MCNTTSRKQAREHPIGCPFEHLEPSQCAEFQKRVEQWCCGVDIGLFGFRRSSKWDKIQSICVPGSQAPQFVHAFFEGLSALMHDKMPCSDTKKEFVPCWLCGGRRWVDINTGIGNVCSGRLFAAYELVKACKEANALNNVDGGKSSLSRREALVRALDRAEKAESKLDELVSDRHTGVLSGDRSGDPPRRKGHLNSTGDVDIDIMKDEGHEEYGSQYGDVAVDPRTGLQMDETEQGNLKGFVVDDEEYDSISSDSEEDEEDDSDVANDLSYSSSSSSDDESGDDSDEECCDQKGEGGPGAPSPTSRCPNETTRPSRTPPPVARPALALLSGYQSPLEEGEIRTDEEEDAEANMSEHSDSQESSSWCGSYSDESSCESSSESSSEESSCESTCESSCDEEDSEAESGTPLVYAKKRHLPDLQRRMNTRAMSSAKPLRTTRGAAHTARVVLSDSEESSDSDLEKSEDERLEGSVAAVHPGEAAEQTRDQLLSNSKAHELTIDLTNTDTEEEEEVGEVYGDTQVDPKTGRQSDENHNGNLTSFVVETDDEGEDCEENDEGCGELHRSASDGNSSVEEDPEDPSSVFAEKGATDAQILFNSICLRSRHVPRGGHQKRKRCSGHDVAPSMLPPPQPPSLRRSKRMRMTKRRFMVEG
jgi:hypothetical protein